MHFSLCKDAGYYDIIAVVKRYNRQIVRTNLLGPLSVQELAGVVHHLGQPEVFPIAHPSFRCCYPFSFANEVDDQYKSYKNSDYENAPRLQSRPETPYTDECRNTGGEHH